jgi:class 3 adenylate cyclase/tetratricopeptide (TPR) repeat protein
MGVERKLATVLFVDLVGSTALVTGTDPEVARRRVQQYFDRVSHCIVTHGGIVEKFAGDAVMAAFGIPQSHEDDAERAVRAALSIMDSVRELGLEARIGIEAGEVVVDEAESTFATGEAVNIAARLQQAGEPNAILIGPGAHRLTLGCFQVEDEGPLEVKGRTDPIWAWRVICVARTEASARRIAAPLVGRDAELELLENTYARAVRDRRAHLFTIYGDPGVGKSRLAREFVDGLESATVLVGRALPYGEGVTYSALSDMVKVAAGIADDDPLDEAVEKLRDCCPDEAVADLLGLASGVLEAVQAEHNQQEISWAARAWAEKLAEPQPLVLAFEDIHWAEEPLLELIEHLGTWVREVPLLILCLARPELLDIRPGWGGGRVRATAIELEPLGEADSEALIDALLDGEDELPASARSTLLAKTEGNPLFVEETVRMLAEANGTGVERIPDTLRALIAARIDHLPQGEKSVLQRAAVIGRIFWADAVAHLGTDPEEELEPLLDDLLLREFVLKEPRSTITGEDAYRFKHVLIREVAHSGLSKTARASHHLRFAEWLKERAADELLEVRAYHLDHASALLAELDGAPPEELAVEAADVLERAGKRALAREANETARKLLLRSVELEPTMYRRFQAARAAWRMHDFPVVSPEMEQVLTEAREAGDRHLEARALTALAEATLLRDADVSRAEQLGKKALEVADTDEARVDALQVLETVAWWRGRLTESEGYAEQALELARRLGRADLESAALLSLAGIYTSRQEDDRAEPLIAQAQGLAEESGSLLAKAKAFHHAGELHSWRDRNDEALAEYQRAFDLFSEVGSATNVARTMLRIGTIKQQQRELDEAEKLGREAIRILKPLEDRGTLCEVQRFLAEVLLEQGKVDEAEMYALRAVETVGPQDVSSQASTKKSLALIRANQGRDEEAEALFRESIETLERSEYTRFLADPLEAIIEFLIERQRVGEAVEFQRRLTELRTDAMPEEAAAGIV